MADKKKQAITTRKQLVGIERERVVNRILLIVTAVIVVVVFGLIGWGIIQENFIVPRIVVAVVEGEEIRAREFQTRVRTNRQQSIGTYMQLIENYQFFASDAGISQQILGQLNQIQTQLDPTTMGGSTVNQLVDDRLIALEAEKLGITASEEQIEKELQAFFGYFPEGTPTPIPTFSIAATSTLSESQLAIVTLTPTPTLFPSPSVTPAIRDEDEPKASATPLGTADTPSTPLPSATPFTQEGYQIVVQEFLKAQEAIVGLSEEDLRFIVRTNIYRNELFEIMTKDVPTEQEQVWARHILVEDVETAKQLLNELENGADWSDLAAEHSLDLSNSDSGGDLDWFPFDNMVPTFATAAFILDIGDISPAVESSFGWHIIQVLGHEMRPLSGQQQAEEQNRVFQNYVQGLRSEYEWEIFDTWLEITPDDPEIPLEYRITQQQ